MNYLTEDEIEQTGMGLDPATMSAAISGATSLMQAFMSKKEDSKTGLTKQEAEQIIAVARAEEQKKYMIYGVIGLVVIGAGIALYFYAKKK